MFSQGRSRALPASTHHEVSNLNAPRRRLANRRWFVVGLLALCLVGQASPGQANPVVCATVSYRLLGGTRQYVLNNQCHVPTSWPSHTGSSQCVLDPMLIQVCWNISISDPL